MPNRFDIFISRIETKSARDEVASHSISDQHRTHGDKANAKPVRPAQALAEKDNPKDRNKHHA